MNAWMYREPLNCFLHHGFTRLPSLPMTRLNIDYPNFDAYMERALNSATRRKLRKKFRTARVTPPISIYVVTDITPVIEDIYPLYLQVYDRSRLRFEKLTKTFLCGAFTLCMLEGEAIYAEYM
jgi:hypothetical protein